MTTALEGAEGSASRPGHSLPPGKTQYPFYRRLDGAQGRSGQVQKISPPPGYNPQTVQPVASHYTDYATWPTEIHVRWLINTSLCKDNILYCLNLGFCLVATTTLCICGQPKGSTSWPFQDILGQLKL